MNLIYKRILVNKGAAVKALLLLCFQLGLWALALHDSVALAQGLPSVSIELKESGQVDDVVPAVKILAILTVLSIAPAILLMTTSFTRILVVLSFVRQALGTQTMPPNQVVVGLAFFLTLFTMAPVWDVIKTKAYDPYVEKKISHEEAITELIVPVKKFMLAQTRESDLGMFFSISQTSQPETMEEVPMSVLMPAFMVSELKTAFQIGFLIYIPFLIIDMVISSVLMAMGMMMLPPTVVSLPFKLVLFVLVDGWALIVENIVKSFNLTL